MSEAGGRIPYWRRLSVRVGLLVALLAWGAQFVHRALLSTTLRVVNSDDVVLTNGALSVYPETFYRVDPGLLDAVAQLGTPGHESVRDAVRGWWFSDDDAFVVSDAEGSVLETDYPNAFPIGEPLVLPEDVLFTAKHYPVRFDPDTRAVGSTGELRWLTLLSREWPASFLRPDELAELRAGRRVLESGTVVISETEYKRQIQNYERTTRWATAGAWLVTALLAGGICSWFVTRRLAQISGAAADRRLEAYDEADFRGDDEIAALGRELRDSRKRIRGLIREVEDKDEQRREWFTQVSHDLRTPLTALSVCLERAAALVTRRQDETDQATLRRMIDVARDDTDRVQILAQDLLDAARLELPGALDLEALLPTEVADKVVRMLQPLATRAGKSLTLRVINGPIGTVRADGKRLMRVFENLVRNGIDFATSEVVVEIRRIESSVRMTVLDDGPGFGGSTTAATVSATTDDPRRRDRADSTGIGLVVVGRALAAHGVDLDISNRPAGGASLSFSMQALERSGQRSTLGEADPGAVA